MICVYCNEPVTELERVADRVQPIHRECDFRSIMGSVAHLERRCGCYVPGSEEGDPPGVSLRVAAAMALFTWMRQQEQREKARS